MIDIDHEYIFGRPREQLSSAYVISRLIDRGTDGLGKLDLAKMSLPELYMLRDGINERGLKASCGSIKNACFAIAKRCAVEIAKRPWKEVLAAINSQQATLPSPDR